MGIIEIRRRRESRRSVTKSSHQFLIAPLGGGDFSFVSEICCFVISIRSKSRDPRVRRLDTQYTRYFEVKSVMNWRSNRTMLFWTP
jgi:hypothetical protein